MFLASIYMFFFSLFIWSHFPTDNFAQGVNRNLKTEMDWWISFWHRKELEENANFHSLICQITCRGLVLYRTVKITWMKDWKIIQNILQCLLVSSSFAVAFVSLSQFIDILAWNRFLPRWKQSLHCSCFRTEFANSGVCYVWPYIGLNLLLTDYAAIGERQLFEIVAL